ncbi:Bis(5'-nucleosyl)-tetraphosphatase, symmetrical [hydrothermal vent metagenome]|uniref:bis(5'-nucleosyl)-tetraphosphatase (symmetrical) n=1 Tax=hydrothermal vent metagenome TaxID=652676 RepID=A0A1W1C7D6_9ZZZZ
MVWAIGDIQGCHSSFMRLLKEINFDPSCDKLWIAGDLVNRGEDSLSTLRYLYKIRDSIVVVLGNHDLALIAAYLGIKKSNASIEPILKADDADILINWLRSQKFLHTDFKLGYAMSHAGISPEFDLDTAIYLANKIEAKLSGNNYSKWLIKMFGKNVDHYDKDAEESELEKYILSSFIRMRFCYENGGLDFKQKGAPNYLLKEKQGLIPWFDSPNRKKLELKVIFGHWSTLGYYNDSSVCCLDTGCVWGGSMTAMRIDDGSEEIVQIDCN